MANALYGKGREKFLSGGINWLSDNIKLVLVDTDSYTVSIDVHEFLSSIPSGARIATSANLTNKSATLGVADADDTVFLAVTGNTSEAIVIYKDTGNVSTSPLIAYIDTVNGLPVIPNGGNISITFDNGANKIFKL